MAAELGICHSNVMHPVLGADAGVEEIRHAIHQMLATPDYRAAARRMAAIMAHQNGRETATKELEALLSGVRR